MPPLPTARQRPLGPRSPGGRGQAAPQERSRLRGKPKNPVVLEPSLSAARPWIAVAARQVPRLSCATNP
jgi:hypothetical protein